MAYWVSGGIYAFFDKDKIANHFEVKAGICTGENAVYILNWQEVDWAKCSLCSSDEYLYTPHNKGGEFRKWYGNKEFVLKYNEVALVKMAQNAGFRHDGKEYYFRTHIGWSKITSYKTSFRLFEKGYTFDSAGLGLFPVGDENLYATLALLNSNVCEYLLGILNPTLNVTPMIVKLLPYDVLTVTEDFVKENISFSRTDWDSFETSWDFRRHPLVRPAPTVAEVCTVREDESEAVEISGEELDFCIFCIQMLAEHLDMPDEDVYLLLTEKTDLLDGYILRNWKVLHTKEKEYIIEELMERMQGKRGL